jgi:type IV secretory pathway VirB4 component
MNPNQPTNPAPATAVGAQPAYPSPDPQVIIAPPSGNANPNSTQNTLQISEIRDGIVIMNDGSFRAVIMCKSINFDLMSPQEREAVEFSYQGFLNSLYFPIQIFIRSQKVDMRPYLEKLDKIRSEQENMLLALLMEDYVAFLSDISQQTNIMDKKFYVVIQYPDPDEEDIKSTVKQSTGFFTGVTNLFGGSKTPHVVINESTLENAKTELRNRVQAAMQGLMECGVQSIPLDTEELIELYYDAYNPDTATRQKLKDFNELSAPVVTKGVGNAPQPGLDRETTQ